MAETRKELTTIESSVAGSTTADERDVRGPAMAAMAAHHFGSSVSNLCRRHSGCGFEQPRLCLNENRWPRRLSFSDAEEAVLQWEELVTLDGNAEDRANLDELANSLFRSILDIREQVGPWVEQKLGEVEALDEVYGRQQEELLELCRQRGEAQRLAREEARGLAAAERGQLAELLRDVETWGQKLEYEVAGLESRVQDFEAGIDEFEARVAEVERSARDVKAQLESESWIHWAVRTLTGIGTGPNITREQQQQAQQQGVEGRPAERQQG